MHVILSKYLGSILAAVIILAAVKIFDQLWFLFSRLQHDWPWPTLVEKSLNNQGKFYTTLLFQDHVVF